MIMIKPGVSLQTEPDETYLLKQIERAARNCYRSEDRITPDGESAKKLVKMLMTRHHDAMLEFADITVRLTCDIGTYKDLTRHRHCSFAIESTRYCNYKEGIKFIIPANLEGESFEAWMQSMKAIEDAYKRMAEAGCKPDQLRHLLPHSTAAEVFMKANVREWRHVLKLRTSNAAHPNVQQVMGMVLKEFKEVFPTLFGDL